MNMNLPYARNVKVADLALYLRKAGWRRVPHPNERLLVFRQVNSQSESGLKVAILRKRLRGGPEMSRARHARGNEFLT